MTAGMMVYGVEGLPQYKDTEVVVDAGKYVCK
jgi:hypothetical protein